MSSTEYGGYGGIWHLSTHEIIKILNSEIFEDLNNSTLNRHQNAITKYFEEQKIDGKHIMSTAQKDFKVPILEYCGSDKKLDEALNNLQRRLMDYRLPHYVDNQRPNNPSQPPSADPSSSWEEKFNALQQEHKKLKKRNEEIETELQEYKDKKNQNVEKRMEHSKEFWQDIEWKLDIGDTDSIKSMIKNKKMTVWDVDQDGYTILLSILLLFRL